MVKTKQSPEQARRVITFLVRLFSLFSIIAAIGAVISLGCVNDLIRNSSHVDALVVDLSYGAKGARAPIVRFKTASGETLQLKSQLYTSPSPNVGDTIKIVYRNSDPKDWQIDDWIHLYFWTLFSSVFMIAWAIAAIVTKAIGEYSIRKLERAEGCSGGK